ncbi:U-box domain-containing protein 4-like [Phalaenopsis equestris]|uniref:U-box domain-containing protein 4-like n=1 Tax=Phalaenopsis equestris TaxID=78828 RepID=UPI0009E349F3|nr:U-box domain-containing protein 4-like [Phalaenopsis equestris]
MAEQKPVGEGMGEGSREETATGDTEEDLQEGRMELSSIKILLNSISCFGLLSSSNAIKAEIVKRYCQKIDEILMLLKLVLEEAVLYEIIPDAKLTEVLIQLDSIVNEASELLRSWHETMSKVYFVIQNEPKITKIQTLAVMACQQLKSSYPSAISAENVGTFTKKIESVHHEKISDKIKVLIENHIKTPFWSENLEKISNFLSLSSNEELLMEVVSLDKLKSKLGRSESHTELERIDQILELITYMHDCLIKSKQLQSINGVPVPPDFCCPLSLELMSDPVIVASGQTYERVYIKKWLDRGFNVCPKTRQMLGHSNLIPNYTVKALIENWCESNDIKPADPVRSTAFISHIDMKPENGVSSAKDHLAYSNGIHHESYLLEEKPSSSKLHSTDPSSTGSSFQDPNESGSSDQIPTHSKEDFSQDSQIQERIRGSFSSNSVLENERLRSVYRVHSDLTHASSDDSGDAPPSSAPQIEPKLTDARSRCQIFWRRPSDRFNPKTISSPSVDTKPDLSGVETEVRKLVADLRSESVDTRRSATEDLRLLAKHNMENRIVIANCGAIPLLVVLLNSTDPKTQANAVTALLNLSINDNNKIAIANADAIDPLVHVLETGNSEWKENSAARLFSLSVIEEYKVRIGRSGAIKPLVALLGNGSRRGKKDAATALFNLSTFHENKARIVQAGAVRYLVDLMDPAAGMVDKAVAVLANLATIPEGRTAIGREHGIPVLVEVVELGSARGKENAASALLQLCTNSNRFCSTVLQEGAVPPLVALSQSGTPRAREKAQALLSYFRTQRHGGAGRA